MGRSGEIWGDAHLHGEGTHPHVQVLCRVDVELIVLTCVGGEGEVAGK